MDSLRVNLGESTGTPAAGTVGEGSAARGRWRDRDIGRSGVLPIEPGADYGVGHAMGDIYGQSTFSYLPTEGRCGVVS